jgi:predicted dinucleotide-binding enzyme
MPPSASVRIVRSMTRIGVIGSGNIGETVGEAWRRARVTTWSMPRGRRTRPRTVAIADAISGAEVVLLALPGGAVPQLLAEHGAALDGRVVIDATNDVGAERLHHADTYGESAPGARFVRAFNTVGFEMFADPSVGGEVADLFWCGPEDAGIERLIADGDGRA